MTSEHRCPTCGSLVTVHTSGEGTSSYEPRDWASDPAAVERGARALYELWISKLPTGSQFFDFDEMAEDLREEAVACLRAAQDREEGR